MKKIILLIFVIAAFNSSAQTWAPTGATWYYSQTHYFSSLVDYYRIESIGDTTINGISCRILQKNTTTCDIRPIKEFMYDINNRVYFWDNDLQNFQMLYNFDAQPGDSWNIELGLSISDRDTMHVTVDSIAIETINGFNKKILFLTCYSYSGWWNAAGGGPFKVIEGIGCTAKMFYWDFGACDGNWAGPIRCYEDGVIGVVDFDTNLSCDTIYYTGIEEYSSEFNFTIFPNPIESEMFVQQTRDKFFPSTFKLINLVGENVLSGELNDEKNRIDLSAISSGTYFIRINSKDKTFFKKIIKL